VGNELAGTHQAATRQHQAAAIRHAEAMAADDPAERARLEQDAAEASALAAVLDARAAELQRLDDARAEFWIHRAETRAAAVFRETVPDSRAWR
jgi:hypothetical protein